MFKIGQLVTTKDGCNYAITSPGKPLEITGSDCTGRLLVKCLWNGGTEYSLPKERLRPMKESEVLRRGQKVVIKFDGRVHQAVFTKYSDYSTYFDILGVGEIPLNNFSIINRGGAGIVV